MGLKRGLAGVLLPVLASAAIAQEAPGLTLKPESPVTPAALAGATWIQGEPLQAFEPGRVYLLECWATWCGPCLAAIPHVNGLHRKYHDRGLRVIGVNVWEDGLDKVRKFVAAKGDAMSYPVVYTGKGSAFETEWLKAAGIRGIPNAFVVRDGKLVMTAHPTQLTDALVEALLDGGAGPEVLKKALASKDESRQRVTAILREIGAASDRNDLALMEARMGELEKLDPQNFALPMLRIRLQIARKEWDAAAASFAAMAPGLPRMLTASVLSGAITGGGDHGFSPAVVAQVRDVFAETVSGKGEKATAIDYATLAALAWHAGNKDQALADAEHAVELFRTANDGKTPPAELFERFAEGIRKDQKPNLRELREAPKPPRQPAAKTP